MMYTSFGEIIQKIMRNIQISLQKGYLGLHVSPVTKLRTAILLFFYNIVILEVFLVWASRVPQGPVGPPQSIPIVLRGCLECLGTLWRPCGPIPTLSRPLRAGCGQPRAGEAACAAPGGKMGNLEKSRISRKISKISWFHEFFWIFSLFQKCSGARLGHPGHAYARGDASGGLARPAAPPSSGGGWWGGVLVREAGAGRDSP